MQLEGLKSSFYVETLALAGPRRSQIISFTNYSTLTKSPASDLYKHSYLTQVYRQVIGRYNDPSTHAQTLAYIKL
jgi:hypothetical protein